MPDIPEPVAQHPRLAEHLKSAFRGQLPDSPEFQRFIELLAHDYTDAGNNGTPETCHALRKNRLPVEAAESIEGR